MLPFGEAWTRSFIHRRSDTLRVPADIFSDLLDRLLGEQETDVIPMEGDE